MDTNSSGESPRRRQLPTGHGQPARPRSATVDRSAHLRPTRPLSVITRDGAVQGKAAGSGGCGVAFRALNALTWTGTGHGWDLGTWDGGRSLAKCLGIFRSTRNVRP